MTNPKPVLIVVAGAVLLATALVWISSRDHAAEQGIDELFPEISTQSGVASGSPPANVVGSNTIEPQATSDPDSVVHEGTPADMEPYDPRDWRALNELQLLNNHWDYRDGIVISVDFGFLTKYLQYQNCHDVVSTSQTSGGELTSAHRACDTVWVYDHAYDSMPMEQLEILARTDAEAAVMLAEKAGYSPQGMNAEDVQRYMNAVALADDPRVYRDFMTFRGGSLRFSNGQLDLNEAEIGYIMRAAGAEVGLVQPSEVQYYVEIIEENGTLDRMRLQTEVDRLVEVLNRTRYELVGETFGD